MTSRLPPAALRSLSLAAIQALSTPFSKQFSSTAKVPRWAPARRNACHALVADIEAGRTRLLHWAADGNKHLRNTATIDTATNARVLRYHNTILLTLHDPAPPPTATGAAVRALASTIDTGGWDTRNILDWLMMFAPLVGQHLLGSGLVEHSPLGRAVEGLSFVEHKLGTCPARRINATATRPRLLSAAHSCKTLTSRDHHAPLRAPRANMWVPVDRTMSLHVTADGSLCAVADGIITPNLWLDAPQASLAASEAAQRLLTAIYVAVLPPSRILGAADGSSSGGLCHALADSNQPSHRQARYLWQTAMMHGIEDVTGATSTDDPHLRLPWSAVDCVHAAWGHAARLLPTLVHSIKGSGSIVRGK